VTILLSWTFVHVIFALHYAHEFYAAKPRGGGLTFPGGDEPDYWDFLYFSLVIGMTSQVSDVAVTGRTIRRTVAAHGVVSFLFNAALIALTVNIAASALVGWSRISGASRRAAPRPGHEGVSIPRPLVWLCRRGGVGNR